MLLAIRDRATGWIAWIIVSLLVITFALWGVHEYVGGGAEPVVASVEGHEITRIALSEQVERVLRNTDERPEGEEATRLRRQVLDSMIAENVLVQAARDAGMRIPTASVNEAIRQEPAFQVEGRFDQERYIQLLNANRIDPEQFWSQQRRDLLRQQLLGAIGSTAFVTPEDIDAFIRLRDRKVTLSFVPIRAAQLSESVQISEEQIKRYYEDNPHQFQTPEQVKLKYLELDPTALASAVPLTEQQLQQMYDERKDSLFEPERLRAARILIRVPPDADPEAVAAARARAEDLRKQIAGGEDFAAVARQHSDDEASAAQGGDIGSVSPGSRDESFELALAELEQGQISEPVRTAQGFEIIRLVERIPAGRPTFAQARERIEQEYRRHQAEEQFYQDSETLYDLTFENPLTLDIAAKALDLEVQETGWIGRDGTDQGLGAQPDVVRAAFSDELLGGGNPADAVNSKLIELKSDSEENRLNPVVVFRVSDYRPAELKPLEQVRDQIQTQLHRRAVREQAEAQAAQMLAQLREGAKLDAVASQAGLEIVQPGSVERTNSSQPAAVIEAGFALGKPADGNPRYGTAPLPDGGMAVIAVTEVQDGDPEAVAEPERQFIARQLARANGLVETGALIDDMRGRADVSVNEEALRRGDQN